MPLFKGLFARLCLRIAGWSVIKVLKRQTCVRMDGEQAYRDTLQTQVLETAGRGKMAFGADLSEQQLRDFQEEQIGQLYELMLESNKPNRQFHIQEDGSPK